MKLYFFEKLEVWQRGRVLVKSIYQLSRDFPSDEKFGMVQQINKSTHQQNMHPIPFFRDERQYRLFLLLVAASGFDVLLVLARAILEQVKQHAIDPYAWTEIEGIFGIAFGFLVWNLFLAWIPYWASLQCAYERANGGRRLAIFVWCAVWLVFLPNAPYIVTDFIHLQFRPPIPVWYDMVLLFAFACTGLMLGLLSLYEMQRTLLHQFSAGLTRFLIVAAIGLSGFGVWLGRFQRWNSWDLLTNPDGLLRDLALTLAHRSQLVKAAGVSGLIAGLVLFGFAFMSTLLSANRKYR